MFAYFPHLKNHQYIYRTNVRFWLAFFFEHASQPKTVACDTTMFIVGLAVATYTEF